MATNQIVSRPVAERLNEVRGTPGAHSVRRPHRAQWQAQPVAGKDRVRGAR